MGKNSTRPIRTLANSALVNSDPNLFGPVNEELDHWSIRTFLLVNSDLIKHFSLVSSDLFQWSIFGHTLILTVVASASAVSQL